MVSDSFTVTVKHECAPSTEAQFTDLMVNTVKYSEPAVGLTPAVPASLFPEATTAITKAVYTEASCGTPVYTLVPDFANTAMYPIIMIDGDHNTALNLKA